MCSQLLWVTLSIVLAQATVPPVKVLPVQPAKPVLPVKPDLPVKPVKPAPLVKANNRVRPTEREGVEKKPKKGVKYVAEPDAKHGSNNTIFAYRYGKNLGLSLHMFNFIVKFCRINQWQSQ